MDRQINDKLTMLTLYKNKKALLSQIWPRDARYISRSWAVAEIWPFEVIQDGGGRHLEFVRIENSAIRPAVFENPGTPHYNHIGRPVAEIWPFEICPRWRRPPRRHLGFVRTVNSAVRSAVPKNPTLEPNMKWIGSPVAEIWSFAYVGGIWNPILGRRGDRRG